MIAKREKDDLTVLKAAEKVGIGNGAYFRAECGNMPSVHNYKSITAWLGVPMEKYVFKTAKPKANGKKSTAAGKH